MNAADLNHGFGIAGALVFEVRPEGLVQARLASADGEATVCLQGGHVIDWQCRGQTQPLLWLSRDARFAPGKSIRGGIPVCWPWFGPHAPQQGAAPDGVPRTGAAVPAYPAHGFARTEPWQVSESGQDADGRTWLLLTLDSSAMPASMWPHASTLALRISLGVTLQLSLTTRNTGTEAFVLGEALHTYFHVSDIGGISVAGLHGVDYWDTVGQVEKKRQSGPIVFKQETDRVYINSPQACVIEDLAFSRRIHIRKQRSLSTVVWSPWTDKAARMGDLGQPDGWRSFVCVESANAWDNTLTLAAGETHALSVEYAVETL